MTGRGRLIAVIVVALALLTGGAYAGWRQLDSGYDHALERYDNEAGEPHRYVNLPDGEAQLAIGSPDGHRVVVQWRDPDGSGWTAPETVWRDRSMVTLDNTVRYGGGTVAILQTFSPDTTDDSDDGDVDVGIVCRELTCVASDEAGYGGEPQVSPDGRWAYLGQDERGAYLWSGDDPRIRRAAWSGHPGVPTRSVDFSEPSLSPDGSLRVVIGRRDGSGCRFELRESGVGDASLAPRADRSVTVPGAGVDGCRSSLYSFSSTWVQVLPHDYRADPFWFAAGGDDADWAATERDPSGLEAIDAGRGCCASYLQGFVHWHDVALGSPDGGRTIRVQTHLLGEESWGEPVVLDGAPEGHTCSEFWPTGSVGADGFAAVLACEPRDDAGRAAYVVVASPDLASWESRFVADVRGQPELTDERVRVGPLTWTPEDGFPD